MKEKLTLQDLVDLLAKKTSLTKKEADAFFRELFTVIIDDAFSNEPVKIKDFGTFKITKVNSRESVNVNTGEKIEIPAHYKLSFLPDKALKNLVNKPFAQFETTLMEDGVSFDSIEESEEPAESPEEEDTASDELETVEKKAEPATREQLKDKNVAKDKEEEDNEQRRIESPIASPHSFVVTTTNDKNNINLDSVTEEEKDRDTKEKTEIETVEIQLDDIFFDTEDVTEDVYIEYQVGENSKESIAEPEKQDDTYSENDVIDLGFGDTIPLDTEKIQEKIDQLKKAIEVLTLAKQHSELLKEKENQPEVSEEVVSEITEPLAQDSDTTPVPEFEEEITEVEEENIPDEDQISATAPTTYEDVTEEIKRDADAKDLSILEKLEPLDGEDSDSELDLEKEGNDDIDEDYYDYHSYNETSWSRFRRRIPIIIFLLAIIGFGAYKFVQLFNKETPVYIPGGGKNLTESDIHPYIHEGIAPLASDSDRLENEEVPDTTIVSDAISQPVTNTAPAITPASVDSAKEMLGNLNRDSSYKEDGYDRIISDYLKIRFLNKAEIQWYANDSIREAIAPKSIATETVKAGSSLRTIATKYYGNYIYWVYLYEENKSKLPDIDNLSIGMELIIPDLKKYGITDMKAAESVEKAKELDRTLIGRRGQ